MSYVRYILSRDAPGERRVFAIHFRPLHFDCFELLHHGYNACAAMAKDPCEFGRALPRYDSALRAILQACSPIILFFSILTMYLGGESPRTMSGLVLFMDVYFPCARTLRICITKLAFPTMLRVH